MKNIISYKIPLFFIINFIFSLSIVCRAEETSTIAISKIFEVEINTSINPATHEHLKKVFYKLSKEQAPLLLIKMTTPGGLVSTTKEILNLFGSSNFPIAIWIAPEGSSATSAGAIIASGAHFLFMSEGTNIGAATPISINGDLGRNKQDSKKSASKDNQFPIQNEKESFDTSDVRAKAVNDLVALVKSLSEARGRDSKSYALMIEEAKSYTAKEAEEKKIIDKIANTFDEIKSFIGTKEIIIKGMKKKYKIDHIVQTEKIPYSISDSILNIFASPELAYILFLMGAALIYFEFQAPGGFIAGGFGFMCLLLAGVGFHVLPVNLGGIGLILLSFVLLILEFYVTSFGLISIAAITALTFGSLILFDTPDSMIMLNPIVLASSIGSIVLALALLSFFLYKTRSIKKHKDFFIPIAQTGKIEDINGEDGDLFFYMIKVNGVLWKAQSHEKLEIGQPIKVDSSDEGSLTLTVSPIKH